MMKKKTYDKIIEQINLLPWKSIFAIYSYYIGLHNTDRRRNKNGFKRYNKKELKIKIKELILKYCNYYIAKRYSSAIENFYNNDINKIDPHIFIIILVISIKIDWEQQIWRGRKIEIKFTPTLYMKSILRVLTIPYKNKKYSKRSKISNKRIKK